MVGLVIPVRKGKYLGEKCFIGNGNITLYAQDAVVLNLVYWKYVRCFNHILVFNWVNNLLERNFR